MKGDTPLDYAVFQLNETQSRCELWICAGDKNEKLASGSLKPFLAHLRAAKEQISKGANFIILQPPPFVGDGSSWFTKRTVEMFVRFVSTPDVLESISIVEAELLKLVDATTILISDSSWQCDPLLKSAPVTPRTVAAGTVPMYMSEMESGGTQSKTYTRRSSFDYAGVALDGSKRDLLKVMETRRLMLLHEQKKTFAQATAAGFNVACISDLMVFANCFGAPRLWEACLKFMTLCKKGQEMPAKTVVEAASSNSSDTDIQLLSKMSDASEGSEESVSGTSINSRTKSRKTWDPQVMSTLQQLYSRKVENACFLSPDVGKKTVVSRKQNDMADEDLVVGARESIQAFREAEGLIDAAGKVDASHGIDFKSKVEHKTISVQDAISLFESKQQKVEGIPRKRPGKEASESALMETPPGRKGVEDVALSKKSETANSSMVVQIVNSEQLEAAVKPTHEHSGDAQEIFSDQNIECDEQPKQPSALEVVSEATEVEEVDTIQWRPLSKSAGYVFDDMFLEQKTSALQNTRRQSLCSWKTTWDTDFEPFDSCTSRVGNKYSDIVDVGRRDLKGRFYDQYQEKREAKLKHEPTTKKIEKEAKLKAMHDVLEKRKVELAAKTMRLSERNGNLSAGPNAIKPTIVKKEVDSRPRRRTSPSTSVHSAPPASKQDMTYPRSIAVRKPSPGSQKSSSATTPRASTQASCDSKLSSTHRSQRRAPAGSLHSDLGKENVDPSCNYSVTGDVEGPHHSSRSIDKKTKGLTVKRNGSTIVDSNQVRIARDLQAEHLKGEVVVPREGKSLIQQKKGKQSPQSRQLSASSAVKGVNESSKIQKAKSDVLNSVSAEFMAINIDADDAESSCSCATVDESTSTSREEAAVEEMQVEATADKGSSLKETETEKTDESLKEVEIHKDERVKEVETEVDEGVKEVESEMDEGVQEVHTDRDEGVKEVQTEMDEGVKEIKPEMDHGVKEAEVEKEDEIFNVKASGENQRIFEGVEVEAGVISGNCELPHSDANDTGSSVPNSGTLNVDMKCGSDPCAAEVNVTEGSPKDGGSSVENKDQIAITTMDQVVAKIYQNHVADLTGTTKTPLFELAELDYKISAATAIPLEDVSSLGESEPESSAVTGGSSTGGSSVDSKVGSFGSSKGEPAAVPFSITDPPMVGSFLPKQKCFPAMLYRKSSEPRASSEPGSPAAQKLPLFDLLVTEQNAAQNAPRPSKSSSHKLPHMCRLPSPDTSRGALLQAHKKLSKSSVAAASASAVNMSEAKSKESLKGFKRFLRFGRKSCGSASSERIMWQNGWFRGDRETE